MNNSSYLNVASRYPYVPALDGLRCCAVLLVLGHHGTYGRFLGGWVGVDVFFVLSGYLITGLLVFELVETGRVRLGRFYMRRALRLLPALIGVALLAGLLWRVTSLNIDSIGWTGSTARVLLYAANFSSSVRLGTLSHCWSLSVEEHFYLVWPPLLIVVWKLWGRTGAIAIALIAATVIAVFRAFASDSLEQLGLQSYRFTLTRADSILIGSAAAMLLPPSPDRRSTWAAGVATACIAVGGIFTIGGYFNLPVDYKTERWPFEWGFTAIAVVSAVLVVAATRESSVSWLLSRPPLVWIGKRSYGVYLYHFPIFEALESLRVQHSVANYVLVTALRLAATFAVATLSYRYVERPFLNLKDRMARELPAGQT